MERGGGREAFINQARKGDGRGGTVGCTGGAAIFVARQQRRNNRWNSW